MPNWFLAALQRVFNTADYDYDGFVRNNELANIVQVLCARVPNSYRVRVCVFTQDALLIDCCKTTGSLLVLLETIRPALVADTKPL